MEHVRDYSYIYLHNHDTNSSDDQRAVHFDLKLKSKYWNQFTCRNIYTWISSQYNKNEPRGNFFCFIKSIDWNLNLRAFSICILRAQGLFYGFQNLRRRCLVTPTAIITLHRDYRKMNQFDQWIFKYATVNAFAWVNRFFVSLPRNIRL